MVIPLFHTTNQPESLSSRFLNRLEQPGGMGGQHLVYQAEGGGQGVVLVAVGDVVFFSVPVIGGEGAFEGGCQQGNLVGREIAGEGTEWLACLEAEGHGAATAGQELEEGHGAHRDTRQPAAYMQQVWRVPDGYTARRHDNFLFGLGCFCFSRLLVIDWR